MRLLPPLAALLIASTLSQPPMAAQTRDSSTLSDAEVEQLRDAAYVPSERLTVFSKLLDTRLHAIEDLLAKPRRPGREEDLHDLLQQFTALSDELNDNLDDYDARHRDVRKTLPRLLEAVDRWSSGLRGMPENDTYNLSRKLALQSLRDVREESSKLLEEQKAFFAAHPEAAKAQRDEAGPQSRPRTIGPQ